MRLHFDLVNGANGRVLQSIDINEEMLSDAKVEAIRDALNESRFFEMPPVKDGGGLNSAYYRIRVVDGNKTHQVEFAAESVPERLKSLITLIKDIATKRQDSAAATF